MLWSLQMVAGDDKAPARFATALRRIESAIFDFCKYGGANRLASILCALGAAERESSVGTFAQKPAKGSNRPRISPLGGLSAGWLTAADDGSHEFRLARGLTTIEPGINGTGAIRRYLEPVDLNPKFKSWEWGEGGGHVVWTGGSIARNLGAILTRRLMEAEKNGEPMPPLGSTFPVSLSAIAAFLDSEIDDAKLEDLIWGLALVERGEGTERRDNENDAILHRVYALTKLTLLPGRLEWVKGQGNGGTLRINSPKMGDAPGGVAVKPELAIPARLRGGDVKGACEVAARRLRASGFSLIAGFLPDGSRRDTDWSTAGVAAERLHAALLFPIPNNAVNQLSDLVLRRPPATTLV
jgi:CRISPR-associated protein Csx17